MNSNLQAKDFNVVSLLKFDFPIIVMMLFMELYTIVDTIFVLIYLRAYYISSNLANWKIEI